MTAIGVALPSSILSVEPSLLLKTIRVHQVIRYCSIFRVSKLLIYRDPFTDLEEHSRHAALFSKIGKYLETPPYLRKKVVPIDRDLKYVGVLPPLRLEVYSVSRRGLVGERRLGYLFEGRYADVGLDSYFEVVNPEDCKPADGLVHVELISLEPPLAKCVGERAYLGPSIEFASSFKSSIEHFRRESDLLIATSRRGRVPALENIFGLSSYESIALLFGAPKYGLYEIASEEGFDLESAVEHVWNTIPNQGVKTVRTEEALISTLAILNILLSGK